MREEDIAAYLQENPQFFESHADMLAGIAIPHPYGGRTISLSERQLLALREKNKALEKKLQELIAYGTENDELQHKVHQFACALYGASSREAVRNAVLAEMRERFSVPHVELRVWEDLPPSAEVLTFADQTLQPVCLHRAMYDTATWFGEAAEHLRSFAYLPLRDGEQSLGLLVFASEDPQRFYPEMGSLYLQRIAELATAALKPHL